MLEEELELSFSLSLATEKPLLGVNSEPKGFKTVLDYRKNIVSIES